MERIPLNNLKSENDTDNIPKSREGAYEDKDETADKINNTDYFQSADRIPYTSIYEDKDEMKKRGYFIPAYLLIPTIVNVERNPGNLHLTDRYIYTIELQHGPYKWLIERCYSDFQRLNNALKIYKVSSKITTLFDRNVDTIVLPYSNDGGLIEMSMDNMNLALRTVPNASFEPNEHNEQQQPFLIKPNARKNSINDKDDGQQYVNINTIKRANRFQISHKDMPDFPTIPDSFISEEKLEERKLRLQNYLSFILQVNALKEHPETVHFLEVSRLSFVYNLGAKYKEGIVKKRPEGFYFLRKARNCCFAYCANWRDTWLTLKDSFVAHIDYKKEYIRDVILFSHDFDVYTHTEYPGEKGEAVRKGLYMTNGSRYMQLKCENERDAIDWKREIQDLTINSIWCDEHRFSSSFPQRYQIYAQYLIDGESFMNHAANIMELAKEEILIADWCLHPYIYMKRPISDDRWRLDSILKRKADEGVRVFILLYKEVKKIFPGIGSLETASYLMSLSPNIKVLRHPEIALDFVLFWSHHEKLIVIDQNIALVGGIDLCYGRWDDHEHKLLDLGTTTELTDPNISVEQNQAAEELKKIYQQEANPTGTPLTTKKRQVGAEITPSTNVEESLSVEDIMKIRYDRMQARKSNIRTRAVDFSKTRKIWPGKDYVNLLLSDADQPDKPFIDFVDRTVIPRMPWHDIGCVLYGSIARDVARHFIQRWNEAKVELVFENQLYPFLLPKSYDNVSVAEVLRNMSIPCNAQLVRSATDWSTGQPTKEDSIQRAYLKLIEEAQHYIYIENQFFISSFAGEAVQNKIVEALYDRIIRAHKNNETFRVYVVMPLLPGYQKGSSAIHIEMYFTYMTISHGPNSLLRRLEKEVGDPSKYISFYSLRTRAELLGKLITEVLYIHSKLIIVDDIRCLIGSANINDRSQEGDRDSELAVVIEDHQFIQSKMNGQPYRCGAFSGALRRQLFNEHLGLLNTTEHDPNYIDSSDPVCCEFYDQWKEIAKQNTAIYEQVFNCTPSNDVKTKEQWVKKEQTISMAETDKEKALQLLKGVRGHLVEFPTEFLSQTNLLLGEYQALSYWIFT